VLTTVTLPGNVRVQAGGELDQAGALLPDWGVYADACWEGWPGVVIDWPDFGLPCDDTAAISAIVHGFGRARQGQNVLVGCRGGTGRTGTILACLAVLAGVPAPCAVRWVRDRYRAGAVETELQEAWVVDRFAKDRRVGRQAKSSRTRLIKATEHRIRNAMSDALAHPQPTPSLEWAVPGVLAVTQRPLRAHPLYHGSGRSYPPEARQAIEQWVGHLRSHAIRSVVVLTSDKELAHYDAPTAAEEGGLLAFYESRGLRVLHFPADDPAHDVTARDAFQAAVDKIAGRVADSLCGVPLPAVMHCSAGIDRSPPVAARVAVRAEVCGLC